MFLNKKGYSNRTVKNSSATSSNPGSGRAFVKLNVILGATWYQIATWTSVLADTSIFGSIGAITGIEIGTALIFFNSGISEVSYVSCFAANR